MTASAENCAAAAKDTPSGLRLVKVKTIKDATSYANPTDKDVNPHLGGRSMDVIRDIIAARDESTEDNGEAEAVECLIEAVAGNTKAVIAESADVLYHLIVLWVASGIKPDAVWDELKRREGISGIAEKASRARNLPVAGPVRCIPPAS